MTRSTLDTGMCATLPDETKREPEAAPERPKPAAKWCPDCGAEHMPHIDCPEYD